MAGIKDYSTTAASNTSVGGVSIAEGMLPSNINNAFRAITADIREWFNDSQWVEYGDGDGAFTAAYASATSFTIAGTDVTGFYHAGRRIKLTASTPGTIYGTISSSTFSTNTTVNVTWDSGSLSNEAISNLYVGILSKTNDAIPTGIGATKIADGSVSDAEFQYLNGVTSAIQTQLNAKQATITGSATTIDTESLTANRAVISNASQKIAVSATTDTELGYLSGTTSAVQTQLDAKNVKANNLSDVASASTARTNLGLAIGSDVQAYDAQLADIAGLTPTDSNFIVGDGSNFVTESGATARTSLGLGTIATQAANNVAITGGSVTGMSTPSSASDVTTKSYVDDLVAGLKTRIICRAATTANIDLTADLQNGDTLDGITLATGNRILVKDQSTGSQNGIYTVVASGTASRDTDFDTTAELAGQLAIIQEGTSNGDKIFLCTTDSDASLGSDTITFTQVQPQFTGTVSSVAVADAGSSEFTVTGSPITTSGTINLAVNSISAAKIGNGDVDNTELSYVNGVTSAIQTQIDNKAGAGFAIAMAIAL